MRVREKCFVLCLSIIVAINAGAKSQSFDFEDEKGINHVLVILDAPLEFISGKGEGVSGFVSYDPENPKKLGSIHLQVDSIELNNHLTKNMYGKRWLNAKRTEISFELSSFKPIKSDGFLYKALQRIIFFFRNNKDYSNRFIF